MHFVEALYLVKYLNSKDHADASSVLDFYFHLTVIRPDRSAAATYRGFSVSLKNNVCVSMDAVMWSVSSQQDISSLQEQRTAVKSSHDFSHLRIITAQYRSEAVLKASA